MHALCITISILGPGCKHGPAVCRSGRLATHASCCRCMRLQNNQTTHAWLHSKHSLLHTCLYDMHEWMPLRCRWRTPSARTRASGPSS